MSEDLPKISYPEESKTEPSIFDMFSQIAKSIGEMRQDIDVHFAKLDNDVDGLKRAYGRIVGKVEKLEQDLHDVKLTRTDDIEAKLRPVSEASLDHEGRIGKALAHIATVETKVDDVKATVNGVVERQERAEHSDDKQNEAIGAIVEELGIEGKVRLGRSLPPGMHRVPTFQRMTRTNIATLIVATSTGIGVLAKQIIEAILAHH